jgi:hypothetical protein
VPADDLTTVANLKTYLNIPATQTTQNQQLAGMVTRVSSQIRAFLARGSLLSQSYTKLFDGTGTSRLMLPDWPVTSVAEVSVGARTYQPAADPGPALTEPTLAPFFGRYRLTPWDGYAPGRPAAIELLSPDIFRRGHGNVLVTYTAGYLASETWIVPSGQNPPQIAVREAQGIFAANAGVSYAAGAALLSAPLGTALTAGRYTAPSPLAASPVYTFAAADAGQTVVISYSFVPAALEQACIDAVAALYFPAILGAPAGIQTLRAGQSEMQFGRPPWGKGAGPMFLSPVITAALLPFAKVMPW